MFCGFYCKRTFEKTLLNGKNVVAAIEFFLHNIFVTALVAASAFLTTYNIPYYLLKLWGKIWSF